jgi:endogenous inhibitor of DNA gyrase (YacG/DUF329 family)
MSPNPKPGPSPSLAPGKPCPICGKPALPEFIPFCSRRCGDVDLNRWLSGVYAVPVKDGEDDEEGPSRSDPDADKGG